MQKITPFLWFDDQAEEAVNLYVSVFKRSKIGSISRYSAEAAKVAERPAGSVMTISFQIEGQDFIALNGGPQFTFSQAISFVVSCKDQQEVDEKWESLSQGGEKQQCGWLRDKYGVPWQIVPTVLDEMLNDKDPVKARKVMEAMLKMDKIEIEGLERAYEEE